MEPIAWQFTCRRAACRGYAPRTWITKGDKQTAAGAAQERGWRPCTEISEMIRKLLRPDDPKRHPSLAHWYCPDCARLLIVEARREFEKKRQP